VKALALKTGKLCWNYIAGSRIDSPPTYYQGYVLFGAADGFIYCLRADDGQQVWRFQVAPRNKLIVSHGLLESAWPVHGSIIVIDGKVYAASGRSTFLDGGMTAWVLEVKSGKVLETMQLDDSNVEFLGRRLSNRTPFPGVKTDLLVSDGESLFIRNRKIFTNVVQGGKAIQITTKAGYFDGAIFNRTSQWNWGTQDLGDYAIADDRQAYGMKVYKTRHADQGFFTPGKMKSELYGYRRNLSNKPKKGVSKMKPLWKCKPGIIVNTMLKAGSTLYVAGSPDIRKKEDPWRFYEGRGHGALITLSRKTGKIINKYKLESAPVYHGLSAAHSRLFISLRNGEVVCFGTEDAN